ncbi:MAG: hypothetical protein ACE5EC_03410, partial [Phycisphaerae bacterium]
RIAAWPDTSLALTTYTQDREGRPRWALRTDWPLEDLIGRLEEMLADDAAAKILENLQLRRGEGGAARLELPDMVLAVLSESGDGSLIASTDDLQPPSALFGQTTAKPDGTRTDGPKKKFLLYCRLNLGSGDEEERRNSLFSHLAGVKDVRYAVSLRKSGQWSERWGVIWNPALGGFLKILFQKARHPIECPADAYATAVMHIGGGGGMADAIAGLKPGTIGMRAGGAMGFAAVPGSGFLPFPDLYYQFRARRKDSIIEDIRTCIAEDTQKRRDDDREPAWHEEKIDGRVVFWHDPAADARFGLMPFTYRQVIFFDDSPDESEKKSRLIVAATSTWPEDAVASWKTLRKKTLKMPSSKKTHWQVRIGWRRLYALAQPYLGILAGLSQDATIPPEPDELDDALSDSVINIQVRLSGLRVRHSGPIPIGAVYVPLVAAASLSATADPSSEAARERIACRRLRVLYHHARLFKKDYGRWPATVAELDGYVDFASHPHLLRLRPRDQSFIEDISSFLFSQNRKARTKNRAHVEEEEIDDSLYEIEWSEDEDAWRLMFREGEFSRYQTIYMDAAGEIHRVEKQTLTTNEADGGNADDEKEKALL